MMRKKRKLRKRRRRRSRFRRVKKNQSRKRQLMGKVKRWGRNMKMIIRKMKLKMKKAMMSEIKALHSFR